MGGARDHAGAEEQFRHVLAVGTRTLAHEHPDTLIVRYRIAREMAAPATTPGRKIVFRGVLPQPGSAGRGRHHPYALPARFGFARGDGGLWRPRRGA